MTRSFHRPLLLLFALMALTASGCFRRSTGAGGIGSNVFRYALQTVPTDLDPGRVEDGDTIDLLQNVFEGLVKWNDKNEVEPNLAEKWDLSADGRTYTFHLRDNVRFHNGRKVTASDFVYSYTRPLFPELKSSTAKTYLINIVGAQDVLDGKTKTLEGVKAVDDHTLAITIDKPRAYFTALLTYPIYYVVCKEAIDANGGKFDENSMIGTGPFKLQSYQPGYKVTLAAFADYHGGKPVLSGIERPILKDSLARQNAYESGQLDLTDVSRADLDRIRADSKLGPELKEFPRAAIWYLALNQSAFPAFKKKEVRQAFAYAINKDELIRIALKGTADRANGILPPGVPGFDKSFAGIPYDPAKARDLLTKAGYPGGKNFPKVTISYRQGYQWIADGVLAMRNDLKQNLGIEVDAREVEWGQFLTERRNGSMPCFHLRWGADYLDPQNFLSLLLRTGTEENKVGYSNPEFDRLCDQADAERDPAKRAAMYHQAEQIAVDDAPWVTLYFQKDVELHKPYLKGIRDCLMGHLPHITTTVAR